MTVPSHQLYSIKDLENFTQIKAHTIRVWEQRYDLLSPDRTDSNIRLYSESDLKKLLNIKLLYSNGFKISKIASLTDEEIIERAKAIIEASGSQEQNKWSNDLMLLILDFDAVRIIKHLKRELTKSGMTALYMEKVIPLMKTLGELWQVNTIGVAHEHFFSNIFREFIISQIDKVKTPKAESSKAVLFLHNDEEHEFSILMYYYLLKKSGVNCYYFGQKTPIDEIVEIHKHLNPDFVISTFTAKISEKVFGKIMQVLSSISETAQVIISGNQLKVMNFNTNKNIHFISSTEELFALIDSKS